MPRVDGFGRHCLAQLRGHSSGRGYFQSFHQDWPEQSEIQSEVPSPRHIAGITSKSGGVGQARTKEALDCEEFSSTRTLARSTQKRCRISSRSVRANREQSAAGASQQREYIHKAPWNSMD